MTPESIVWIFERCMWTAIEGYLAIIGINICLSIFFGGDE